LNHEDSKDAKNSQRFSNVFLTHQKRGR